MNTCGNCPDTTASKAALDKAIGTFKNRVLDVVVHRADGGLSTCSLSNPDFSFAGTAGQLTHVGHTGGGWLVVRGNHQVGRYIDVAIWQISPDGTFHPLSRTDKRIGSGSLRFGTDFTIIDAWPI
jgi:hypothetical protein